MAILDFSKDNDKSITLHFHSQELGPEGQPLYYSTPEAPAGQPLAWFTCLMVHGICKVPKDPTA